MKQCFFGLLLFLFIMSAQSSATKLQVVTEHLPPLQYSKNGKAIGGFSTEVVKLLLIEAKAPARIMVINWARAYEMALNEPNTLIFSLTRSPEREQLFNWVGPVVNFDNYLWRLTSRQDFEIDTLQQAKQLQISVPRNDARHQFLITRGFEQNKNLMIAANFNHAVDLMLKGRAAYFAGAKLFVLERIKQRNLSPNILTPMFKLDTSVNYIAFSRNTPAQQVKKFRQALIKVKKSAEYAELLEKWQGQLR